MLHHSEVLFDLIVSLVEIINCSRFCKIPFTPNVDSDADTDNVVFGADVNSHIIPNTDDTYNLGSTTQQWGILYLGATQSTSNTTGSIVTARWCRY